jgi:hypothetical protein
MISQALERALISGTVLQVFLFLSHRGSQLFLILISLRRYGLVSQKGSNEKGALVSRDDQLVELRQFHHNGRVHAAFAKLCSGLAVKRD